MSARTCADAWEENGKQRVLDNSDWPKIIQKYEELWAEIMTQALESQTPEENISRRSIFSYDYFNVFGHYPTRGVTPDTSIRIELLGGKFVKGEVKILPLTLDIAPFKSNLFYEIASDCIDESSHSVFELIENVRKNSDIKAEIVFHHIIRLVKYSILEIVSHG